MKTRLMFVVLVGVASLAASWGGWLGHARHVV